MANSSFFSSAWEIHFQDANGTDSDKVSANIAEFAIGSISMMAYFNPRISVPNSSVPYLGSHLTIQWPYVIALFAGIAGVQFALFTFTILVTKSADIADDPVH